MNNYLSKTIFLAGFAALFFIAGCSSAPEPLPDWVKQQPSEPGYWYGVGIAGSREDARVQAIQEISSQISVEISASLSRIMTEHNFNVNEYTKSVSAIRVQNVLPDIELIDSHNNEDQFYILMRLSQEQYHLFVAEQRQSAVSKSWQLLNQADQEFSAASFRLWSQAVEQIRAYIDDELLVSDPARNGDHINLISVIQERLLDYSQRIKFSVEYFDSSAVIGLPQSLSFKLKCIDSHTSIPLDQIPFRVQMPDAIHTELAVTNAAGEAQITLSQISGSDTPRLMTVTIGDSTLYGTNNNLFFTADFQRIDIPISVRGLKIYLDAEEVNMGKVLDSQIFTPRMRRWLADNYQAVFTSRRIADLEIIVRANSSKLQSQPEKYYGQLLYQAVVDLDIRLVDITNSDDLGNVTVNQLKGISYQTFPNAGFDSYKKLIDKTESDIFPELRAVIER